MPPTSLGDFMQRASVAAVLFASGILSGCVADVDGTPGIDDISKGDALPKPPPPPPKDGGPNSFITSGPIQADNPFFLSLGTNGRSCATCHVGVEGWSMTPADLQARFDATNGTDPVFRTNDGSASPTADVSTLAAKRTAYAMLLNRGDVRVGIGIPPGAEFSLDAVDDPYGHASARELSLFRRPLPSTNLAFESSIYTAMKSDPIAGPLDDKQVDGGPRNLSMTPFYIGINDPIGMNPTNTPLDPNAMTLYAGWTNRPGPGPADKRKAQIARGEVVFNTHPIAITGVKGLNDKLGVATIQGTCTTCHDTPNVGDHSVAMALDIGVSDASQRTPDMPLYTLRNNATGETIQTTDPGKALITGKWADIGKFKGPILRAVALRAPYFHNGSAATLDAVLDFYEARFGLGLTVQERADLVAFLQAL